MIFKFGVWELDDNLFELRVGGVSTAIQPRSLDRGSPRPSSLA